MNMKKLLRDMCTDDDERLMKSSSCTANKRKKKNNKGGSCEDEFCGNTRQSLDSTAPKYRVLEQAEIINNWRSV